MDFATPTRECPKLAVPLLNVPSNIEDDDDDCPPVQPEPPTRARAPRLLLSRCQGETTAIG